MAESIANALSLLRWTFHRTGPPSVGRKENTVRRNKLGGLGLPVSSRGAKCCCFFPKRAVLSSVDSSIAFFVVIPEGNRLSTTAATYARGYSSPSPGHLALQTCPDGVPGPCSRLPGS